MKIFIQIYVVLGITLCVSSGCRTMHQSDDELLFASIKEAVNVMTNPEEFLSDACSSGFSKKILSEFQQIEPDIMWIRDVKWMSPKPLLSSCASNYGSRLTNEVIGCVFVSPFDILLKNRAFVVLSMWGPARTSIISFDRMGNMTQHRVTEKNEQDCILYGFYPVHINVEQDACFSLLGYYLNRDERAQIRMYPLEEQNEVFFYATNTTNERMH